MLFCIDPIFDSVWILAVESTIHALMVDNAFTGGLSINFDVIHSASVVLTVSRCIFSNAKLDSLEIMNRSML